MDQLEKVKNVVSLAGYRSHVMPKALMQVEAYWEGLRNGRLLPARSDVDPRGMPDALRNAFVVERIAPGLARFRIAGTHLSDLMGMEVRGMPLSSIILPEARAQMSEALEAVFAEPAVVTLQLHSEAGFGRQALNAQLILLPLKSDLGDVTRAMGAIVTEGPIGRTPRRFTITSQNRRTLIGYGDQPLAEPAPQEREQARPREHGFTEATPVFRHHRRDAEALNKAPVLRLVKTDD